MCDIENNIDIMETNRINADKRKGNKNIPNMYRKDIKIRLFGQEGCMKSVDGGVKKQPDHGLLSKTMSHIYEHLDKLLDGKTHELDINELDHELLSKHTKDELKQYLLEYYYNNYNNDGELYCLYNPVYLHYGNDVYKLGCSSNADKRLFSYITSYLDPCEYKERIKVKHYVLAEKLLFYYLRKDRISPNREFFKINLEMVKKTFENVKKDMENIFNLFNDNHEFRNFILKSNTKENVIINKIIHIIMQHISSQKDNKTSIINENDIFDIHSEKITKINSVFKIPNDKLHEYEKYLYDEKTREYHLNISSFFYNCSLRNSGEKLLYFQKIFNYYRGNVCLDTGNITIQWRAIPDVDKKEFIKSYTEVFRCERTKLEFKNENEVLKIIAHCMRNIFGNVFIISTCTRTRKKGKRYFKMLYKVNMKEYRSNYELFKFRDITT